MKIKDFKTPCCNAPWYRKGRANYRCTKCDEDVTLHLVFIQEVIEKHETKNRNIETVK